MFSVDWKLKTDIDYVQKVKFRNLCETLTFETSMPVFLVVGTIEDPPSGIGKWGNLGVLMWISSTREKWIPVDSLRLTACFSSI